MILDYIGVKEINGSLIVIDGVKDAFFEETVDIRLDDGSFRQGRIVQMDGTRVVIQVFEGDARDFPEQYPYKTARSPHGDASFARNPWTCFFNGGWRSD